MTNSGVSNKKEGLERCLQKMRDYYQTATSKPFSEDYLKQDAIAINLQRACEICIDLANMTIRKQKLGNPKESRESFLILEKEKIISAQLSKNLCAMVGFRNILVHEYQEMELAIMEDVILNHLDELIDYTNLILKQFI
jgi:uncharacterized protein YutE (UPF0331/DUF86 family)